MGRGNSQRMASAQAILAQQPLNAALENQVATERGLMGAEQLLGTDEQIAGTLGGDENLLRYSQQWSFDPTALNAAGGNQFDNSYLNDIATQANAVMAQARAAYEAGDQQKAEELYNQAVNMPYTHPGRVTNQFAGIYNQSFTLNQSGEAYEDALAKQLVSGPMAQQVGGLLRESRELLDPNSETTARYRDELQGGSTRALAEGRAATLGAIDQSVVDANRAIDLARQREERRVVVEGEAARREVRDLGLSRGAARSAGMESAIYGRFADTSARHLADIDNRAGELGAKIASEAGTQKAQSEMFYAQQKSDMLKETGQFFTEFRNQFTTNAPLMAQAFLQNSGGVRDSYMNRLLQTQLGIADMGKFIAESYISTAQMQTQERLGSMQKQAGLINSLMSLGGGLLESFTGGLFEVAAMKAGASAAGTP